MVDRDVNVMIVDMLPQVSADAATGCARWLSDHCVEFVTRATPGRWWIAAVKLEDDVVEVESLIASIEPGEFECFVTASPCAYIWTTAEGIAELLAPYLM